MKAVAVVGAVTAVNVILTVHASRPTPRAASPVSGTATAAQEKRFDHTVRADFFAGLRGNAERLARAMEVCERTLADEPNHPEALVWHGSGLLFWAGQAFGRGESAKGVDLWEKGKREMDAAVALTPDAVNVLIPRGATLLEASRHVPGEERTAMLVKGLADYEKVLTIQQPHLATLSPHARGELLFGLAEGWSRAGDPLKARRYFEQIVRDGAESDQVSRAKTWLETGSLTSTRCVGCH